MTVSGEDIELQDLRGGRWKPLNYLIISIIMYFCIYISYICVLIYQFILDLSIVTRYKYQIVSSVPDWVDVYIKVLRHEQIREFYLPENDERVEGQVTL